LFGPAVENFPLALLAPLKNPNRDSYLFGGVNDTGEKFLSSVNHIVLKVLTVVVANGENFLAVSLTPI